MRIAVRPCAIERPGRVPHQPRVESEIAGHPGRRLDAMICRGAADDERLDAGGAQPRLQIGADEGAVYLLDDDGLALDLARFIPDRIAACLGKERGIRTRALMANVENRSAAIPERAEQI